MKRIIMLLSTLGLLLGSAASVDAVDINVQGIFLMGFGWVDSHFVTRTRGRNGSKNTAPAEFNARERLRLRIEAVASESLSGVIQFQIGNSNWGKAVDGGTLGADGRIAHARRAYLDWAVPGTNLRFRMGIQGVMLPSAAGGTSVLDSRAEGIVASYTFDEHISLTGLWIRPFNDNFPGMQRHKTGDIGNEAAYYLDNMDLFGLVLPVELDGWKTTPWVLYGMQGRNIQGYTQGAMDTDGTSNESAIKQASDGYMAWGGLNTASRAYLGQNALNWNPGSAPYTSMFWAGLPVTITAFDPLNIEFDINYGYVGSNGRYNATNRHTHWVRRACNERSGWIVKALVEYNMGWGVPGIFGWYGTGDDGNVKNGSERMPAIAPCTSFTSFLGDGYGWLGGGLAYSYAGTWGVGGQLKDVSFMEDLKHTFHAAYWGGTNSPAMVKYLDATTATDAISGSETYLTADDGLLELNLLNTYKIYENLEAIFEMGYIVNMIDKGAWDRYYRTVSFEKGNAWKATLIMSYTF